VCQTGVANMPRAATGATGATTVSGGCPSRVTTYPAIGDSPGRLRPIRRRVRPDRHVAGFPGTDPHLNRTPTNRKIAAQTSQRLAGTTPDGSSRVVSLHEGDARPIAKGRLGKPVEFGYKAQLVDNEDGVIVDYNIEAANPPDAPMLLPAVERIRSAPDGRRGRSPRTAATARPPSRTTCGCECPLHRRAPQGPTERGPPPDRAPASVPQDGPLADRL